MGVRDPINCQSNNRLKILKLGFSYLSFFHEAVLSPVHVLPIHYWTFFTLPTHYEAVPSFYLLPLFSAKRFFEMSEFGFPKSEISRNCNIITLLITQNNTEPMLLIFMISVFYMDIHMFLACNEIENCCYNCA